jgi:type IV pilus assembly protein PilA
MIGGINMLKNKNGFTLIELLAVIVILAVILAIAVPGISGIIDNTKKSAFESDIKMIIVGIEYQALEASYDDTKTAPAVGDITASIDDYGANPANYTSVSITALSPITINATSVANGKFGAWTVTGATKATVSASAAS